MGAKAVLHKPDKNTVIRYLLLLGVLLGYFGYLSWKFDIATGGVVAALTWSFFVLCTPIADAGFLLDFPLRLLFGIRMVFSEICVWITAISLNMVSLAWDRPAYDKTPLTALFEKVLLTPWPYWIIIALSCLGTFLSIYFGDEVMDLIRGRKNHDRTKIPAIMLATMIGVFLLIFAAYYYVLTTLGVKDIIE